MTWQPPTYRWKIWYEDGSAFSSDDGEPWESPPLGVVVIAQPRHDTDILIDRTHYIYREDENCWAVHDLLGLADQLLTRARHISCYRIGRMMASRSAFRKIWREAVVEVRGK